MEGLVFTAMAVSALLAGVVGARLLALGPSSEALPLRILGGGLLLGSGATHALVLVVAVLAPPRGAALRDGLLVGTLLCIGAGATAISRFNHMVYRPRNVALHAVTALVASYFALLSILRLLAVPAEGPLGGPSFYLILLGVYGWSGYEALTCYAAYRRAPGLDPLVVDRFRVWGIGTLCAMGWVASAWMGGSHVAARALGAAFSLLLAFAVLFAFAPPRWYRHRVRSVTAEVS